MKNIFIKSILSILCGIWIISPTSIQAQLNIGGEPYSFNKYLNGTYPTETMPPINLAQLQLEDEEGIASGLPALFRFGYSFKADLNLTNSGTWIELKNGDRIWRLLIECPGARSINLTYDWFWLPEGAVFYIYSPDKTKLLGGFTSKNNKGQKEDRRGFATSFIKNDQIVLEYYEPAKVSGEGVISINKVVHGYRTATTDSRGFGDSGPCQVNINCEEGDDWQDEKRAVALVVREGTSFTGSLLNNTCQNFDPLFLLPNHGLDIWWAGSNYPVYDAISNPNADEFMFLWDYEGPGCANPSNEPSYYTTTGCVVLANDETPSSDFGLVRLTEDPKDLAGYTPYYLGWDRTGNYTAGGVLIHHPESDIKKIATFTETPSVMCGQSQWIGRWYEVFFAGTPNGFSIAEPGSSGSPFLDQEHRVIGQLNGGNDCPVSSPHCNDPANNESIFPTMSHAWENTGNNSNFDERKLRPWLDPCNTGVTTLDGLCLGSFQCDEITDLSACCYEGNHGLIILNCEEPGLHYEWSFPTNSTAQEITNDVSSTIVLASEGSYSVTITDNNDCSEVREYEIVTDCCDPSCPTPENLECQLGHGFAALSWDEIGCVEGYNVFIIEDDPDCCGTEFGIIPGPFFTTDPYFNFQLSPGISCISWQVQTVCDQSFGEISDWSEKYCLKPGDCFPAPPFTEEGDNSKSNSDIKVIVYPNPNYGELNLELETPGDLTITVEIYSLDGKLVKTFAEEKYPDGYYKKNWSVNDQITDGLYIVFFKTNYGTFQEKVVIAKENYRQR